MTRKVTGLILMCAALIGVAAAASVGGGEADAASFRPGYTVTVANTGPGINSDITDDFYLFSPDANYSVLIRFTPPEFFRASDGDIADGAYVASLDSLVTLGILNGPCSESFNLSLQMLDATTDASITVPFEESYLDSDGNGLEEGVDKYPDFLRTLFPGLTPTARWFGMTSAAGMPVSLNILTFEPGTTLYGVEFDPALGRPSVFVLNDPTATATLAPSAITDFCTPLTVTVTTFGISKDNPETTANESGYLVSTNPTAAGDYGFASYTRSQPDADDDGLDNTLDTCPFDANAGEDDDNDGLDNVCDPDSLGNNDYDDDGFWNRGDNCPLVANPDNRDGDVDGIGDVCDPNPDTPDGDVIEEMISSAVTITPGPATMTPRPTATCPPAATYEGTVFIDGAKATSGINVKAYVDGILWAETTTEEGGRYKIDIPTRPPLAPPCFPGGQITFETYLGWEVDGIIGGAMAEESPQWDPGPHQLNLTFTTGEPFCSPVFPARYTGVVSVEGDIAPEGTTIAAIAGGEEWATTTVGQGGRYVMDVPGRMPVRPPCFPGGRITFRMDELWANESVEYSGQVRELNLTFSTQPPATPTPATTPTPGIAPTPAAVPAGGLGAQAAQGQPWWPLALLAAAGLLVVSGLATCVRR
jgi:hypothetical protein